MRDNQLIVKDKNEEKANLIYRLFQAILTDIRQGKTIDERDFRYMADHITDEETIKFQGKKNQPIGKTYSGKLIYPKTAGQLKLSEAMHQYDILFAIGPAGTGKTYLAVVYATTLLKENKIKKIILTRPAVEAGENLGFLPGDLKEKVDPYLQPLYDALYDCLGMEQTNKLMEKSVIEIAPLAYMRGRTLDDAFIILDEAQNTTMAQMKMFLTRLGMNSKMIINGDITQIDLKNVESGLISAKRILTKVKEICFIQLHSSDVVRHPLVQKIIEAYGESQ